MLNRLFLLLSPMFRTLPSINARAHLESVALLEFFFWGGILLGKESLGASQEAIYITLCMWSAN